MGGGGLRPPTSDGRRGTGQQTQTRFLTGRHKAVGEGDIRAVHFGQKVPEHPTRLFVHETQNPLHVAATSQVSERRLADTGLRDLCCWRV